MRVPPTRSASRCAPRARSTSPRRSLRLRACCSRWRRGRTRTSPTSRATSGPRSSRRCRPTTSSTRCSGGRARMPQHARRLKIRRNDLRKPDEFETLTGQALAWAGEHPAVVYGVLAVAIVVLVGSLAVGRWRASRNEAAAVAFRSAQARFDEGKFHDAAEDFAYVVERYPHAPLGRLAALYPAHALARQGDQAAAATAYGEYLASAAVPDYLRQEALVGLARAKEAAGDMAGGPRAYTQAGARPVGYPAGAPLSAPRREP